MQTRKQAAKISTSGCFPQNKFETKTEIIN